MFRTCHKANPAMIHGPNVHQTKAHLLQGYTNNDAPYLN